MTLNKNQDQAIIVKKLLNIFAALPNCQSTGGVSIEMAKPILSNTVFDWFLLVIKFIFSNFIFFSQKFPYVR
jgi:hypothetical protein